MSTGSAQRLDPALLTRKRKAAMIVQLMLTEGQNISLSRLPEDMQMRITRELGALRIVDKDTLRAVVEEFSRDLESVGLAVPGGVASALAALSGQISPNAIPTAAAPKPQCQEYSGEMPQPVSVALKPGLCARYAVTSGAAKPPRLIPI